MDDFTPPTPGTGRRLVALLALSAVLYTVVFIALVVIDALLPSFRLRATDVTDLYALGMVVVTGLCLVIAALSRWGRSVFRWADRNVDKALSEALPKKGEQKDADGYLIRQPVFYVSSDVFDGDEETVRDYAETA